MSQRYQHFETPAYDYQKELEAGLIYKLIELSQKDKYVFISPWEKFDKY